MDRETHNVVVVEETTEYVIYLCPQCGYRAQQWFDGRFERLNLGNGNVVHVGTSSQVTGAHLQVAKAQTVQD